MTPAPAAIHQIAVLEIAALLRQHPWDETVGLVMMSPADLELEPGSVTQPDVFVVPATVDVKTQRLEWSDVTSLLLAIEAVSPSTARIDRVEKREYHCDVGVREYWIFDLDAQVVERWTPIRETAEIVHDRLAWTPPNSALIGIDLVPLFDRIATATCIRRVPRRS